MPNRITSPFGTISLFSGDHDNLIEEVFGRAAKAMHRPEDTTLAVDIYEDEGKYVLKADLPGVAKEDVQVTLVEGVLTIDAQAKPAESPEKAHWLRRERRHGHYLRSIQLGGAIDGDKIAASLKNGVLELTLPKPDKVERKTIAITGED